MFFQLFGIIICFTSTMILVWKRTFRRHCPQLNMILIPSVHVVTHLLFLERLKRSTIFSMFQSYLIKCVLDSCLVKICQSPAVQPWQQPLVGQFGQILLSWKAGRQRARPCRYYWYCLYVRYAGLAWSHREQLKLYCRDEN